MTMATAPNTQNGALPFIHPDDMPDRYALTGRGTCMEPMIPDGALVAFDKREEPLDGDIVGLIFGREAAGRRGLPGMIKRLVIPLPPAGFDGLIVVEQINPPRTYTFSSRDVLAVHKFIGLPERGEDGSARLRLPKEEKIAVRTRAV
jgi:phage repressor protein C with HTH and peptisase S24 domain